MACQHNSRIDFFPNIDALVALMALFAATWKDFDSDAVQRKVHFYCPVLDIGYNFLERKVSQSNRARASQIQTELD